MDFSELEGCTFTLGCTLTGWIDTENKSFKLQKVTANLILAYALCLKLYLYMIKYLDVCKAIKCWMFEYSWHISYGFKQIINFTHISLRDLLHNSFFKK